MGEQMWQGVFQPAAAIPNMPLEETSPKSQNVSCATESMLSAWRSRFSLRAKRSETIGGGLL